eukprot:Gb_03089 [translate_table: standard]
MVDCVYRPYALHIPHPHVEDIEKEVQELRTTVKEQESTIQCLQKELGQKSEQLIFISDEKTVGEEALEASQNECNQLASLIKELDERMTQLTTALTTRTIERDSAVSAEKRGNVVLKVVNNGPNEVLPLEK